MMDSSVPRDDPPTPSSAVFSHHNSSYSRRSSIRPLPVPPALPTASTSGRQQTPEPDRSSVESIHPVGISAIASPPEYKAPDPQESYRPTRHMSTSTALIKEPSLDEEKPVKKKLFASYESPSWVLIILHVGLCLVAYPILMIFVLIARDRTLFWTRFAISCGCGIVGFCLALSLVNLARAYLEAATWATLIHQSRLPDSEASGLSLRDFAAASQGTSALVAARVLYNRIMYPGTARKQRKEYDARPWSLYVVYFLFLVLVSAALPFILGRLVEIDATVQHQHTDFREVRIKGDLSDADLVQAQEQVAVFDHPTLGWTMAYSSRGPPPTAFSYPWGEDQVYFAEATPSQLREDGAGFGVFNDSRSQRNSDNSITNSDRVSPDNVEIGTTLRYPRWGIRMHCSKVPNPERHLIPKSTLGLTYLFAPRETMTELYSSFGLTFPQVLDRPLNTSLVIRPGDNVSVTLDPNSLTLGAGFFDNGVAHSYFSTPISMGRDGGGFVSFEAVLVRLNTTFAPQGNFATSGSDTLPDESGNETRIGYDALLCLELFEPWIVEVYNSTTGVPFSTRIVAKAGETADIRSGEQRMGDPLDSVKRQLNSSALWPAYVVAHQNSVNQLVKVSYTHCYISAIFSPTQYPHRITTEMSLIYPPPLALAYSASGEGPNGYTELSPTSFAQARSQLDASNLVAFFSGTGDIVGRSYPDQVLSSARILTVPMVIVLVVVLIFGVVAGMFVPRLPLGVPRRDFELYSWVAAFHGDRVAEEMNKAGIHKNMELSEVEKRMGNLKFRYVF
ncbi:hypothetical protein ONZ45_g13895 [Pleurotus djamor]|nr:hypothetical protein ONZ45_g13895 [Pleurotus djamor]